jgi:hypothetical protein
MQSDQSRFHNIAWMAAIALSVCAAALPATAYASEIARNPGNPRGCRWR